MTSPCTAVIAVASSPFKHVIHNHHIFLEAGTHTCFRGDSSIFERRRGLPYLPDNEPAAGPCCKQNRPLHAPQVYEYNGGQLRTLDIGAAFGNSLQDFIVASVRVLPRSFYTPTDGAASASDRDHSMMLDSALYVIPL